VWLIAIANYERKLIGSRQADAIAEYSHLFRRSEGLYLRYVESDEMEEELLSQIRNRQIDLVVCSDAEAILGIGDQGVGVITIRERQYLRD
jgi:malate dehydrogenase (oxaloacetate-decarboxylating)